MTKCVRCDNGDSRTPDGFHALSTGRFARCANLPPYDQEQAPLSSNEQIARELRVMAAGIEGVADEASEHPEAKLLRQAAKALSGNSSAPETSVRIEHTCPNCGARLLTERSREAMSECPHAVQRWSCTICPPLSEETSAPLNHSASCGAHDGRSCDCGKSPQKAAGERCGNWPCQLARGHAGPCSSAENGRTDGG